MPMPIYEKAPGDKLDFPVDFADVLAAGDTLQSAVWTVPAPLTKDPALGGISGTIATAYIYGAAAGEYHTVTVVGTSVGGVVKTQSIVIKILEA